MLLRFTLLLALLALLASSADAQIFDLREPRRLDQWVFGLNGFGGIPVGEFRKQEDGGGGMEMTIGFQPFRREPLVIRSNAGFLMYGAYNRDDTRDVCDFFGNNCQSVTFFYDSRYHNMSFFQVGPELTATDGRWRPFAYALTGITLFNSWSNYGDPNNSSSTSRGLFSSHNWSSAYGGGLRIMKQSFGREGGFELAVRFTRNPQAKYVTDRNVYRRADGTYDVVPVTGAANVVGIHLGFWMGPYINWNERRR